MWNTFGQCFTHFYQCLCGQACVLRLVEMGTWRMATVLGLVSAPWTIYVNSVSYPVLPSTFLQASGSPPDLNDYGPFGGMGIPPQTWDVFQAGILDGRYNEAQFNQPMHIRVSSDGLLAFVCSNADLRMINLTDGSTRVLLYAPQPAYFTASAPAPAPCTLLYVITSLNGIFWLDWNATAPQLLQISGQQGTVTWNNPRDLLVSSDGSTLYVAHAGNMTIDALKIDGSMHTVLYGLAASNINCNPSNSSTQDTCVGFPYALALDPHINNESFPFLTLYIATKDSFPTQYILAVTVPLTSPLTSFTPSVFILQGSGAVTDAACGAFTNLVSLAFVPGRNVMAGSDLPAQLYALDALNNGKNLGYSGLSPTGGGITLWRIDLGSDMCSAVGGGISSPLQGDGNNAQMGFNTPTWIASSSTMNMLYVTDQLNMAVKSIFLGPPSLRLTTPFTVYGCSVGVSSVPIPLTGWSSYQLPAGSTLGLRGQVTFLPALSPIQFEVNISQLKRAADTAVVMIPCPTQLDTFYNVNITVTSLVGGAASLFQTMPAPSSIVLAMPSTSNWSSSLFGAVCDTNTTIMAHLRSQTFAFFGDSHPEFTLNFTSHNASAPRLTTLAIALAASATPLQPTSLAFNVQIPAVNVSAGVFEYFDYNLDLIANGSGATQYVMPSSGRLRVSCRGAALPCPQPQPPNGTNVGSCTSALPPAASCSLVARTGYQVISGTLTITCDVLNGFYTSQPPVMQLLCQSPAPPAGTSIGNCTGQLQPSQTCTLGALVSWSVKSGSLVVQCNSGGVLSSLPIMQYEGAGSTSCTVPSFPPGVTGGSCGAPGSTIADGSVCNLSLLSGYTLVSGLLSQRCSAGVFSVLPVTSASPCLAWTSYTLPEGLGAGSCPWDPTFSGSVAGLTSGGSCTLTLISGYTYATGNSSSLLITCSYGTFATLPNVVVIPSLSTPGQRGVWPAQVSPPSDTVVAPLGAVFSTAALQESTSSQGSGTLDPCAAVQTSGPLCANGGTCVSTVASDSGYVLSCACPAGTWGPLCGTAIFGCVTCTSAWNVSTPQTVLGVGLGAVHSISLALDTVANTLQTIQQFTVQSINDSDPRVAQILDQMAAQAWSTGFLSGQLQAGHWQVLTFLAPKYSRPELARDQSDKWQATSQTDATTPTSQSVHSDGEPMPAVQSVRDASLSTSSAGRIFNSEFGRMSPTLRYAHAASSFVDSSDSSVTYEFSSSASFNISLHYIGGYNVIAPFPSLVFYSASKCTASGLFDLNGECVPCPKGCATCPGGGQCYPSPEYWSWTVLDLPLLCTIAEACPGAQTVLLSGSDSEKAVTTSNAPSSVNTQACSTGYTGVGCATCATNYYALHSRCYPCGSETNAKSQFVVTILLSFAIVGGLAVAVATLSARHLVVVVSLFVVLQQVVTVGQSGASSLSSQYRPVAQLFGYLSVINFEIQLLQPGCVVPSITFVDQFWFTLGLIGATALLFLLACVIRWQVDIVASAFRTVHADASKARATKYADNTALTDEDHAAASSLIRRVKQARVDFHRRYRHSLLILLAVFYLQLHTLMFGLLRCVEAPVPSVSTVPGSPVSTSTGLYLAVDLITPCFAGEHTAALVVVCLLFVSYTLVFPVVAYIFLSRMFASSRSPWIVRWLAQNIRWLHPVSERTDTEWSTSEATAGIRLGGKTTPHQLAAAQNARVAHDALMVEATDTYGYLWSVANMALRSLHPGESYLICFSRRSVCTQD